MAKSFAIKDTTVITMNASREVLSNTTVLVENNRIAAVGPAHQVLADDPDLEVIDGRGRVVLPGLINAHTHIAMSLQKGVTQAVPEGIYRVMWPVEKALTAQDIYYGALIGGAEALINGCTTVVDHYFQMEQIAKATVELGLRGFMGHTIMSRLGPYTGEHELREGIDFVSRWKGKHPLVTPMLAPHASDTVSTEWLRLLREEADRLQVGLHLHLAQSTREQAYINQQHDKGCVEYLVDMDFLRSDVLAAHCIYIEDHELDILADSGAHPVYCPMGHSLSGHPMRTWELLGKGAPALIATDCVTNNNVMDLLGELRIAGAAQRQMTGDNTAMPSMKILEMVTVDAAKAIGMEGKLGAVVPGYLADLTVVNMHGLHAVPNYSVVDNIIYTCNGRDVEMVVVDGEIVVRAGKLLTADEEDLIEKAETRGPALIKRAVANDPELAWMWE